MIGGHRVATSVSIGIGVYPTHGMDINALLKSADLAMYRAKEVGKNGFQFFAESYERPLLGARSKVK